MADILTIDCEYTQPEFAAAYLMQEGKEAAFIETNTAHAVPKLLLALRAQGLTAEQVRYVIVTHVHLNHAGGASLLMKACPNAQLLAHPKAAKHLVDPSRLLKSARQVYGEETFDRLYGEILPIEAGRVREMADGERLKFGNRSLEFFYTRGHANHHFCIFDSGSRSVFTGDAFGLAYPTLQKRGLFILPSTSPTDFDPAEARVSIDKILACGASCALLTHFGEVRDLEGAAAQLRRHLDFSESVLEEAVRSPLPDDALQPFCRKKLDAHYQSHASPILEMDLELNAAGITHVAKKRRHPA